ncbi:MAG: FAD-dependent oxidoreductase [Thermomicrobiales bacterium]|nr:FAD-dependent oxidoreductase [Thermomicrobiales bacterium]
MTEYDIAIIGGGPAGAAAVEHLAWRGIAEAVWIDESNPDEEDRAPVTERVQTRSGTIVWGAFPGFELATRGPHGPELLQAKRLILATGATAVARSFPGSDRPGVMTGDGLQRLLTEYRVWPGGKRVAIVGDDIAAIARLRGVIEDASGDLVVVTNDDPAVMSRDGVVGAIRLADGRVVETDIVAICAGRQPDIALALMLECATGYSGELGGFVPVRSADMETSVPGLYACGDCAGIGSVGQAIGEGVIAAEAAARSLGFGVAEGFEEKRLSWERANADRQAAADIVSANWQQHFVESVRAGSVTA